MNGPGLDWDAIVLIVWIIVFGTVIFAAVVTS